MKWMLCVFFLNVGAASEPEIPGAASRNLRGGVAVLANSSRSLTVPLNSSAEDRSAFAQHAGDPTIRCGTDRANADSICGKKCSLDGECDRGQRCFAELDATPCARGGGGGAGDGLTVSSGFGLASEKIELLGSFGSAALLPSAEGAPGRSESHAGATEAQNGTAAFAAIATIAMAIPSTSFQSSSAMKASISMAAKAESSHPVLLCSDCPTGHGRCVYASSAGGYDGANMGIPNDSLSSVQVRQGWKITLYEHGGYAGASLVITGGSTTCLTSVGFNDKASSWIVEREAGPSPPSPAHSRGWGAVLDRHNYYRSLHGASPLSWDSGLAQYAQAWANRCQWKHSHGPHGENLHATSSVHLDAVAGVNNWYNEVKKYDFNSQGFSHATGHFTQVVWKGTRRVGCAAASCSPLTGISWRHASFLVCSYDPPGNVQGQFGQNVQRR